jgi:hypothetical protein
MDTLYLYQRSSATEILAILAKFPNHHEAGFIKSFRETQSADEWELLEWHDGTVGAMGTLIHSDVYGGRRRC